MTADGLVQLSGQEVIDRVNARDEGANSSQILKMELVDGQSEPRVRVMRYFRKNLAQERHLILFFLQPQNLKDTAFLTLDYAGRERDDDQWLYLPAARNVRRISSSDRGGYFFGSDLTYEDVKNGTKVSASDYQWKSLGTEVVDERSTYVVEGIPTSDKISQELGYGRVKGWVDPEMWMIRRAQFWDVNDNALKSIVFSDFRQIDGIWTTHHSETTNEKTNHRTVLTSSEVRYNAELPADLFTEQSLQRGQ